MLTSQLDFSLWFNWGYWRENTSMKIVWYISITNRPKRKYGKIMGYRIQGTQSEGSKIWKTSLKIGITTTSKMDDIHMSWSKQNYIAIVGVYSSRKCDNFTLLQRHILNRLYRLISIHTGTNPYQIELVETLVWTLCTENHIIENYMMKSFLVCIPHLVPTILQWLLGTTTSARWLLMDCFFILCGVISWHHVRRL